MNQEQVSAASPAQNPGSILIDHIRSFLHLTTQAPLEYVCKSALYLLTNVPATRLAVFEYLGTFYKVATFLHIRYNLSLKSNQKGAEQQTSALLNNITHINPVLDLIESKFGEIFTAEDEYNIDLWSQELSTWLVELMGDIILNKGVTFTDTPGLSEDESKAFKSLTLIEALEFWSSKCKPTTGILKLIQRCFVAGSEQCQSLIIDQILNASSKYTENFDWILCDLAALNPQKMFEKCLKLGFNEFRTDASKVLRTDFINFYALNYSYIVKIEIDKFISNKIYSNEPKQEKNTFIYLLKLISITPSLFNLLLNEILSENSNSGIKFLDFFKSGLSSDDNSESQKVINANIIDCVKQLNNNIAAFDLISYAIDYICSETFVESDKSNSGAFNVIKTFLEEIEICVYNDDHSSNLTENKQGPSSIPFLNSLNTLNGISFKVLLNQIFSFIRKKSSSNEYQAVRIKKELLFKFLMIMALSGNDYFSNSIMIEFLKTQVILQSESKELRHTEWPFLLRFRQEINPFYNFSLRNSTKSLARSFNNETAPSSEDQEELYNFVQNMNLLYDWDLKNNNNIGENMSFILIDHECFISLTSLFSIARHINSHSTYTLLDIYVRILKSNEDNLPMLELTVSEMIIFSDKIVNHFFMLYELMNENNIGNLCEEMIKINEVIKYMLMHLSYLNEEKSPFRNILLRTLVDKLFEISSNKKNIENITDKSSEDNINDSDMNNLASNLFNSNLNLTNNDITSHKRKFKNYKNTLAEFTSRKVNKKIDNTQYTIIMSHAFVDLLETLCSRSLENTNEFTKFMNKRIMFEVKSGDKDMIEPRKYLLVEQMGNVADMLVQHVMLDTHYIDNIWPTAMGNESEENIEAEIDAMKLYIERDVAVQNIVENTSNNKVIWMILDFLASDEQSFFKCIIIIRSLLASIIIKWDSYHEQPTKNIPKLLDITLRLLNLLNKVDCLLPKPLGYIVDIVPLISSYEAHVSLLLIWKYLKNKLQANPKLAHIKSTNAIETKQLRFIFQKNIVKLDFLYSKFFRC